MKATITAIETHFPRQSLDNEALAAQFPHWPAEKILEKTGIERRYLSGPLECASDLGVAAAIKLFASGACQRQDIDYLLLCTSSPDYALPTTACLMQSRLELRTNIGAIDINQGCSGFVYGLGLAQGLIETGQARSVLLVTAETYSRYLHNQDHSTRTLFGDAAAATLIVGVEGDEQCIGPFTYGTDGRGGPNLIVRNSAARREELSSDEPDEDNVRDSFLHMNGPEIFNFTLSTVPEAVTSLLEVAKKSVGEIDRFVFHQANRFMLDALRRKIRIPDEKFIESYRHCGNTVSSSIPIAIRSGFDRGLIEGSHTVCLVGFGVGYSWAATLIRPRFIMLRQAS